MLLDDVMSELDSARRELLSDLLSAEGQAVLTTTDVDHVPAARDAQVRVLGVTAGVVGERAAGDEGLDADDEGSPGDVRAWRAERST